VDDDFDHDFCEPRLPDELATHPELGGELRRTELCWKESIQCASCESLVPVELVAPLAAEAGPTVSALTTECSCGTTISVAYSWQKRRVVGLRMKRPLQGHG
jgi:hypothetical protein